MRKSETCPILPHFCGKRLNLLVPRAKADVAAVLHAAEGGLHVLLAAIASDDLRITPSAPLPCFRGEFDPGQMLKQSAVLSMTDL